MPQEAEELENLVQSIWDPLFSIISATTDSPPGSQSPYCRTPLLSKVPVQASFMVSNIPDPRLTAIHTLVSIPASGPPCLGLGAKGHFATCWDQLPRPCCWVCPLPSRALPWAFAVLLSQGLKGDIPQCPNFVGKIKMVQRVLFVFSEKRVLSGISFWIICWWGPVPFAVLKGFYNYFEIANSNVNTFPWIKFHQKTIVSLFQPKKPVLHLFLNLF